LVLAGLGAGLGLVVARWSLPLLVHLSPANVRGLDDVAIDGPVLAFVAGGAGAWGGLFGVPPGVGAAPRNPGGRVAALPATAGQPQRRVLSGLVVAETAMGVILLVAAALLLRGFVRLAHTNPGFDPSEVVTLTVDLPDARYPFLKQVTFFDGLLADLARL